ncbi:MAG: hypothetical protein B6D63_03065, partial [Candidatus Latescibacteria bacterium 4484_7]
LLADRRAREEVKTIAVTRTGENEKPQTLPITPKRKNHQSAQGALEGKGTLMALEGRLRMGGRMKG